MNPGIIIGALALVTFVLVLAFTLFHFGFFLKDPRNKGAAKNVFKDDGGSATTKLSAVQGAPSAPLLQRLDESEASTKG